MKRKIRLSAMTCLLVLMGIFTSFSAQAQQRKQQGPPPVPNEQEIEKMLSDLSKNLSLSESQEEQISKLYTQHFDEVKAKMENGKPKREEMEELKSDLESDVKELLDEDQQEKYDHFMAKQKSQRKGKRPERR